MPEKLMADLEVSRLVTLTGGPGAGKSRLAAELADRFAQHSDARVKVVDLADAADLDAHLLEQMDNQPSLLVLDNCEHVIAEVAAAAELLLLTSPNMRILATSRERLGISGEVVRHVRPAEPTDDEAQPGTASAPPTGRYRTNDQAMAGSEALLSDPERVLLRRLSVFAGGFSLEAARQVCTGGPVEAGQVLDLLAHLVDASMVEVHTIAGRSRFCLAPVVAAQGGARLVEAGEEEQSRWRHAAWCLSLVEAVPRVGLDRGRHTVWVAQLEAERDNLRAALDWAVSDRRAAVAVRLARGQLVFWRLTGAYREAAESLAKVLPIARHAPAALQASVHCDVGLVAAMVGDHASARKHLEQSLVLFDGSDAIGAASARNVLALVSVFLDEPRTALRALENNVERARGAGSDYVLSEALSGMATARMLWGEAEQAGVAFEEATATARRAGDDALVAQGLVGAGWAALARANFDQAALVLEEGRALAAELGERYREAVALGWLGELARLRGDAELARQRFEECRGLAASMATPFPLARSLIGLARLAIEEGEAGIAKAWLYEAIQIASRSGLTTLAAAALEALAQVLLAQGGSQATARFEAALEAARRCGDKATIGQCLSGLATAARRSGDLERAWSLHHQALGTRHEIGDRAGSVDSLEALGGLAVRQAGRLMPARLFGAAEALRAALGYPRRPLAQEAYQADVAAVREAVAEPELANAWAQGAAMTLEEAVSYVSRGRGPQRRPRTGRQGLTDTESQVAALVAQGLKNREIAERMLMAPETVKTHVSRIFPKLGVRSRRELVELVRTTPASSQLGSVAAEGSLPRHGSPALT